MKEKRKILRQQNKILESSHRDRLRNLLKQAAFTLAETLITIGIIGVVATMTLPTLITKYQKNQFVNQLKKEYSVILNVFKFAENDMGDLQYCFPQSTDITGLEKTKYFYENCMKKYLKIVKECIPAKGSGCWADDAKNANLNYIEYCAGRNSEACGENDIVLVLADGTILQLYASSSQNEAGLCIDLNGFKGPNVSGKDIFNMYLNANRENISYKYGIYLYGAFYKDFDINNLINNCNKTGSGWYSGLSCGALIQHNNWKIPEDYPW